jgi:putative ABC transport system permease protein
MTLFQLLRRNLRFHRRANLAVLLGVAVGTAVLTGALLVGDSLRGSLRRRTLERLGDVQSAMLLPRFVRNNSFNTDVEPVIVLRGTVLVDHDGYHRVAPDVTVVTKMVFYDSRLIVGPFDWFHKLFPTRLSALSASSIANEEPRPGQAFVTPDLADELAIGQKSLLRIRLPKVSAVPQESGLGQKTGEKLTIELEFDAQPLPHDDPRSKFDLENRNGPARTIFVNAPELSHKLGVRGEVNALFLRNHARPIPIQFVFDHFGLRFQSCTARCDQLLELDVAGNGKYLNFRIIRRRVADSVIKAMDVNADKVVERDEAIAYFVRRGTIDLESKSLLLSPPAEQAALAAAKELNIPATSTLVYLANSISDGTNEIPYSVIAAIDPQLPAPLGPFLNPSEPPLADDEILLADWPDSPLAAKRGDTITVRYFLPESDGKATETSATFKLRGKVPMTGVGADAYLAPEFPGITDKLTLGEWDPPFPYDNSKIKKRDEDYWDKYRATPKAYVNKAVGRKLFGSRFGFATSVRFAATSNEDAQRINDTLLKKLRPEDFGLVFEDVRAKALAASQGGTDFGGLFLGFSMFLIAGALMLVGLLWKLSLDKRASEIGLLFAAGFRVRTVRRLLLTEGLIVAALGALLGLALAIGYGLLMLKLLAALWPDEGVASFLTLHVEPQTLIIGFFGMMLLTGLTVWWSLRSLRRVAPAMLLRGTAVEANDSATAKAARMWPAAACLIIGIGTTLAGVFIRDHEARAGSFFSGGGLLLIAGLLALRYQLRKQDRVIQTPSTSLAQLGRRNTARHPGRSLLTAGLIAAATFLLVAVESFRRNPAADFAERTGGSGGFDLIASMDVPLYQDLNDPSTGRKEMLDGLERVYQKDPASKAAKLKAAEELLAASEFVALRVRSGDDAGCRNLARPDKPRLIGVPQRFIDRGGFQFADIAKDVKKVEKPWQRLLDRDADGNVPVFGEANTVQWMLKKSLGGTLPFKDSHGNEVNLRIIGLLQDSIFQGELVMSEKQFLQLFPETQGYGMLLAAAPKGRADELRTLLETAFADRGLAATPTADKLRSYLAVENTYLSTFQILGGFGLLLGACGLAVVLLRNAVERRGELALLRALGLSPSAVGGMIRAENLTLLLVGMAIGVVAAMISIMPLFVTGEATLRPLVRVAGLLIGVVVVGFIAGALAIRSTLRAPIVPALRSE